MARYRMNNIDFGRHSEDYAKYRPGFPESFYDRLDSIFKLAGSQALDLGTGPGTIALELAARGSSVVGIDSSEGQVEAARHASKNLRLENKARFEVAHAENTGLESSAFDLVTAGQCWHWFDREAAMKEARRVLRPNGVFIIASYCYLAPHSPVARATENIVLQFNPTWSMAGSSGLFPEQIDEVINGGFALVEQFCYQHDEEFSHEQWRGRMRTCNGVGSGGLAPEEVRQFDLALSELLTGEFPEPLLIPHRVWCVVARKQE